MSDAGRWERAHRERWRYHRIRPPAFVACDVHVGVSAMQQLRAYGVVIVALAHASEPDEEWFARAHEAGANVYVSADGDIGRLAYGVGAMWIRLVRPSTTAVMVKYILRWLMRYNLVRPRCDECGAHVAPSMHTRALVRCDGCGAMMCRECARGAHARVCASSAHGRDMGHKSSTSQG